jgi:hypothetical protein
MTLPTSGTITIAQIQTEFGGSNPASLSEYYRNGAYVPDTSANSSIPTSGTITMANFYGGSAALPTPTGTFSAANFTTQTNKETGIFVTSNNLTLSVTNGPITVTCTTGSGAGIQKNSSGSYATTQSCANGNTIRMRFISSGSYETALTKTASMNGDSASFTVITGEDPECFEASTLVLMANNTYKTIADVVVGDEVLGYTTPSMIDQSQPDWAEWTAPALVDGSNKTATVVSVNAYTKSTYYTINQEFKVTASHPLLAYSNNLWQWITIENLVVGDILWSNEGTHVPVTSITYLEDAEVAIPVVTLDVESVDTYFVKGTNGATILAHNK